MGWSAADGRPGDGDRARLEAENPVVSEDDQPEVETREADASDMGVIDVELEPPATVAAGPAPDGPWLRSLPLRSRLADPTIFDEALCSGPAPPVDAPRLHATTAAYRSCSVFHWIRRRYSTILAFTIGVLPPDRWRLCPGARGRAGAGVLAMPCPACEGGGFEIAEEGDVADEPNGPREPGLYAHFTDPMSDGRVAKITIRSRRRWLPDGC